MHFSGRSAFLLLAAFWILASPVWAAQKTGGHLQRQPLNLGDTNADLVYTPVNPCRIIDTRVAGGALTGGTPGPTRQFKVAGSAGFDAQGGNVSGCGVPIGATAVLVNFVAVNAQGAGTMRA
jgi:hypothetical protein